MGITRKGSSPIDTYKRNLVAEGWCTRESIILLTTFREAVKQGVEGQRADRTFMCSYFLFSKMLGAFH